MKDIEGKYIVINCWNKWFEHTAKMVLDHFDNENYNNTVFVLGTYCFKPFKYFEEKYKGKKIIIYQMEQLFQSSEEHWINVHEIVENLKGVNKENGHEVWDMCLVNNAFLKEYGVRVDRVVPLMFSESLEELDCSTEPEIDVFFYGNLNRRRSKILADLAYYFYFRDVSICWMSGLPLEKQKKYVEKSKIILNLHHTDEFNRQEQTRIFYPLINKKCVVSEPSQRNYFGEAIVETKNLSDSIEKLLHNDAYKAQGENGYDIFKRMSEFAGRSVVFKKQGEADG